MGGGWERRKGRGCEPVWLDHSLALSLVKGPPSTPTVSTESVEEKEKGSITTSEVCWCLNGEI